MPVHVPPGYTLPAGDLPLTHARIAHAGNWIEAGSVSASSTDSASIYQAEAPANSLLVEKWKPAGAGESQWTRFFSGTYDLDYCVIAAHDLGATGTSVAVDLRIGGVWTNVVPAFVPANDDTLFVLFEPQSVDAARITLDAPAAPAIGFVRFGKALQMEERTRYAGRTPFELAREVVVTGDRSVTGEPLTRAIVRAGQPLTFQWPHLSEAFTKLEVKALLEAIDLDLFAIAERPETHPDDVALCWTSGSRARPSAIGAMDLHDLQISAEGYVGNG